MSDPLFIALADTVRCIVREHGSVPGSVIGTFIRVRHPDVDVKARFGGLKAFIQSYLSDEVVCEQDPGSGDQRYRLGTHSDSSNLRSGALARPDPSVSVPTPWDAFSNPNLPKKVLVIRDSGDLLAVDLDADASEGVVEIGKLKEEDYRDMSRSFLRGLPDSVPADLQQAVEATPFWPNWSRTLTRPEHAAIFRLWLEWRLASVTDRFVERLQNAGLSTDLTERAKSNLVRWREKASAARRAHVLPSPTEARAVLTRAARQNPPSTHASRRRQTGDLRQLIHSAIDRMSEEELRCVWLPVGVIVDLCHDPRS